jgi:multicomponent Na+:H+ antiporter subunit G
MSGAEFLSWSVDAAFVMVMLSVALGFVRLAKGPTLADRVVALDMMTVIIVAFCGLYAIYLRRGGLPRRGHRAGARGLPRHRRAGAVRGTGADQGGEGRTHGGYGMIAYLAGILCLLGGGFAVIAALGILRLPDVLTRMHASTKAGTLASALILVAVALEFQEMGVTAKAIAAILFLMLTAPIAAHMLGRSAVEDRTQLGR